MEANKDSFSRKMGVGELGRQLHEQMELYEKAGRRLDQMIEEKYKREYEKKRVWKEKSNRHIKKQLSQIRQKNRYNSDDKLLNRIESKYRQKEDCNKSKMRIFMDNTIIKYKKIIKNIELLNQQVNQLQYKQKQRKYVQRKLLQFQNQSQYPHGITQIQKNNHNQLLLPKLKIIKNIQQSSKFIQSKAMKMHSQNKPAADLSARMSRMRMLTQSQKEKLKNQQPPLLTRYGHFRKMKSLKKLIGKTNS